MVGIEVFVFFVLFVANYICRFCSVALRGGVGDVVEDDAHGGDGPGARGTERGGRLATKSTEITKKAY